MLALQARHVCLGSLRTKEPGHRRRHMV